MKQSTKYTRTYTDDANTSNNAFLQNDLVDKKRIYGLDIAKLFSIFAVITIHAKPFQNHSLELTYPLSTAISISITQISRFAVPLFFIINGFFAEKRSREINATFPHTCQTIWRYICIFLFWSFIYCLPVTDYHTLSRIGLEEYFIAKIDSIKALGPHILIYGTKAHLWFIPSLVLCNFVYFCFIRFGIKKYLLPTGLVVYVSFVTYTIYEHIHPDINLPPLQFKHFAGIIFFALGVELFRYKEKLALHYPWKIGIFLILTGLALQLVESIILYKLFRIYPRGEFYIGTIALSVGCFLLAYKETVSRSLQSVAFFGCFSLGIYAVHIIFNDIFIQQIKHLSNLAAEVIFPMFVLCLSLTTSIVFCKITPLKRFFS